MYFMMVFSNQPLLVLINKVITNKRAHNTLFGSYIYISAWLPMVFSYVSFIRIGSVGGIWSCITSGHCPIGSEEWSVCFFTCWCCKSTRTQQRCQLGKEWLLWHAGPSRMTIVGRVYTCPWARFCVHAKSFQNAYVFKGCKRAFIDKPP